MLNSTGRIEHKELHSTLWDDTKSITSIRSVQIFNSCEFIRLQNHPVHICLFDYKEIMKCLAKCFTDMTILYSHHSFASTNSQHAG